MNAWILSLVICSTVPQPDGNQCTAEAVSIGLSRDQCMRELNRWHRQSVQERVECFEDPSRQLRTSTGGNEPQTDGDPKVNAIR